MGILKNMFKRYKKNTEYLVNIEDVIIPNKFLEERTNMKQYSQEWHYYLQNKHCATKIVVNKKLELVDGYISYKILASVLDDDAKIPVYFC